jgi:hypothetical protein
MSYESKFIRPMHPKSEIKADAPSVHKVLAAGWVGQMKVHGHRAQIHIPADASKRIVVFNRQGNEHKKALSEKILRELRRLFSPAKGWNVIDAEWLKDEEKIFVFDIIKHEGVLLQRLSFPERWKLLPRAYISPVFSTLPLLDTPEKCLKLLNRPPEHCEGLVFKSLSRRGFADSSIVRCRLKK